MLIYDEKYNCCNMFVFNYKIEVFHIQPHWLLPDSGGSFGSFFMFLELSAWPYLSGINTSSRAEFIETQSIHHSADSLVDE